MLHHAMIGPGEPTQKSNVRQAVALARIKRAKALLDDSPTHSHSLDDLANATGLSKFQTLRDFTHATGLTPHAYLIQRRIDLARHPSAARYRKNRLPRILPRRFRQLGDQARHHPGGSGQPLVQRIAHLITQVTVEPDGNEHPQRRKGQAQR